MVICPYRDRTMTTTYRFTGDSPEVFPFVALDDGSHTAITVASGDTFDAAEGLVHARIERREGDSWVPTHDAIVPPATAADQPDWLEDMTVPQLRDLAATLGIEVASGAHKAEIIADLREAQE